MTKRTTKPVPVTTFTCDRCKDVTADVEADEGAYGYPPTDADPPDSWHVLTEAPGGRDTVLVFHVCPTCWPWVNAILSTSTPPLACLRCYRNPIADGDRLCSDCAIELSSKRETHGE